MARPHTSRRDRTGRADGTRRAERTTFLSRSGSGVIDHSSHASPGSRISARSRSRRAGSSASTRQKSTTSPTRSSVGWRRPRRIPTPPTMRSIPPRTAHSQVPTSHPRSPPERAHLTVERFGRRVRVDFLTVAEHGGAGPVRIGRHRIRWCAAVQLGVGPTGGHVNVADSSERELDRLTAPDRMVRNHLVDRVVVNNDLVDETVDQWSREISGNSA